MARAATAILACAVAAIALALPARAQNQTMPQLARQRAERMTAAFTAWARTHGVERGAIAIAWRGRPLASAGHGGLTADDPAPIASLSKAVTALCAARLIDAGRLDYETRVGQALAPLIARTAPPADPRLADVTVSQLLAHRSGLPRMVEMTSGAAGMASPLEEQARRILAAPLNAAPGERYEYSNQGYILLSAIIAAVTGEDYEAYCRRSVLAPLGAGSAQIDPHFRELPLAGSGGWAISAMDTARLVFQLWPDNPAFGPQTRAWLAQRLQDSPAYALGFEYRGDQSPPIITHTGLLQDRDVSVSTRFIGWPSGLSVAVIALPARDAELAALASELERIGATRPRDWRGGR